jgi:transcriptional regulator with XRE-family HTH domain
MINENKQEARNKIANLIKELRLLNELSHSELAEKIAIKENTLQRIEQGKFSLNAELLFLILKNLGCSIVVKGKDFKL